MFKTLSSVIGVASVVTFPVFAAAQVIERISVDSAENESTLESSLAISKDGVSENGRFIVFASPSDDLVADDNNGQSDVFLRDRVLGTTVRISTNNHGGGDASGASQRPSISGDGRYIVFDSDAGDLVAGDGNGFLDIFLFDTVGGAMTRISLSSIGGDADATSTRPSISGDGRYVAFSSSATNLVAGGANTNVDIYVRDRTLGTTIKVTERTDGSLTDLNSWQPVISDDGRHVAFTSGDSGLVLNDGNAQPDVFVCNLDTSAIERVSVTTAGAESSDRNGAAAISAFGTVVAWWSRAEDLVDDDTNSVDDIFVRDRTLGTTTRISVTTAGAQAVGGGNWHVSMSHDGRFVAFASDSANLVDDDNEGNGDVVSYDRLTGITRRHSRVPGGAGGNDYSRSPSLTPDGAYVVFESGASNFIVGDTNFAQDVFFAWGPAMVLEDGFESADTSGWSNTVGP